MIATVSGWMAMGRWPTPPGTKVSVRILVGPGLLGGVLAFIFKVMAIVMP
jgi:hypothetical protein